MERSLTTHCTPQCVTAHRIIDLGSRELLQLELWMAQSAALPSWKRIEDTITVGRYLELLDRSDQVLVDLLSEEFKTDWRDSETLV